MAGGSLEDEQITFYIGHDVELIMIIITTKETLLIMELSQLKLTIPYISAVRIRDESSTSHCFVINHRFQCLFHLRKVLSQLNKICKAFHKRTSCKNFNL